MARTKAYMLALFAMKPHPSNVKIEVHPDGSYEWQLTGTISAGENFPTITLYAGLVGASSDEEARELSLLELLKWAPPSEGWVAHHVTVNTATKEQIEKVLHYITEHEKEEDVDIPPEIIT
jgi:hypothetical protein